MAFWVWRHLPSDHHLKHKICLGFWSPWWLSSNCNLTKTKVVAKRLWETQATDLHSRHGPGSLLCITMRARYHECIHIFMWAAHCNIHAEDVFIHFYFDAVCLGCFPIVDLTHLFSKVIWWVLLIILVQRVNDPWCWFPETIVSLVVSLRHFTCLLFPGHSVQRQRAGHVRALYDQLISCGTTLRSVCLSLRFIQFQSCHSASMKPHWPVDTLLNLTHWPVDTLLHKAFFFFCFCMSPALMLA